MTGTFLSSQILPLKGKWEALRQRKLNISDLALTQDPICLDGNVKQGYVLEADVNMQGSRQNSWGGIQQQQQQWFEGKPAVNQNPLASVAGGSRNNVNEAAPTETFVHQQGHVSYQQQQEEMASWLNYPVEESLSKPYCSEMFLDMPTGSAAVPAATASTLRDVVDISRRAAGASADEALALGAERAAGMSSQVGLEAFCKVRTTIQPPVQKWPSTPSGLQMSRATGFSQFSAPASPTTTVVGESVQPLKTGSGAFTVSATTTTRKSPKSTDNEKRAGKKKVELPEPTVTSSSGGSENTTDRPMEKRKIGEVTESAECQSEDVEAESTETKKQPTRPKRSRAAEVHNLSERRRRDRINEKMRALQELIPNSNKTDKASMLDEAIEYLKMLQLQLQMMSMRSGMSIPAPMPMVGIPPMQMPIPSAAMPAMHYGVTMGMGIGMGMNVGMGMGVNLVDPTVAVRPASSYLGEVSDPSTQYLQEQPMPLQVMTMNRDIWQQQQQQQHQQQQHPHQPH